MKKILITGAKGMLAHDLIPVLGTDYELLLTDIAEMDITDSSSIFSVFSAFQPDAVINCAAYTAVDKAQETWNILNYQVNTLWVGLLAKACKMFDADLIHISTDYVFAGDNKDGYQPDDTPAPLNQYWLAKRLGEKLARQHLADTIVVRTARLYGGWTEFPHFVNTMLKLGKEKDELKVVDDQHGLPTYTIDLAHAIARIIIQCQKYHGSTQHFTNSGEKSISRYDFTREILSQADIDCDVQSCWSQEYPRPAPRPSWSELKNTSEIQLPEWKDALQRYITTL